jgi:hypothetical protein
MGVTFRLVVFISSFATYALSFSVHQTIPNDLLFNTKADDLDVSIRHQTQAMNRRLYLSSLFSGCGLALAVAGSPACAAQEENSPSCSTGCMYECQTQAMEKKDRSMSKDRLIQECKEQCQGERGTCQGIQPQRKQEPILVQSKRIQGLYPRWQDDF